MMKKSVIIFVTAAVLSVGITVYGWIFVDSQIGGVVLTEETIAGDRDSADGLAVGFRADSMDNLHWINSFDYSSDETKSYFKRGEMAKKTDTCVYDDIRFTGWSQAPYYTQLKYGNLKGLQEKEIQAFYDEIQGKVMDSGSEEEGKIRLKDYLDFYPVSFQFQFGTKIYDSDNALTGLKVYDERNMLDSEGVTAYDDDVELYTAFNDIFKIPVIDNEYQEYKVSKKENYDYKKSLGYDTEIEKPLGQGEDYYEFDPIIVLQEENIKDGKKWFHPDLLEGPSYEADGQDEEDSEADNSNDEKTASAYNLKNRMLFTVNNKTVKGAAVDVSQIDGGYGVYELPFVVIANQTISESPRSWTGAHPEPVMEELKMVYPLDEEAEYVEMSLSDDHRYLAVFSVRDGSYFADLVDADSWTSPGPIELFPAAEKMTYAWGSDGSLAVTNHEGYVAVLARTEDQENPYEIIYSGEIGDDADKVFFDDEMIYKGNSTARYQYGIDTGLAVTAKDGKAALTQNLLIGDPGLKIRTAALECIVIDENGVTYRGRLKSNLTDLKYDMREDEARAVRELIDEATDGGEYSEMAKYMIQPVRNENWSSWEG